MCDENGWRLLILLYESCYAAGIIPAKGIVHRILFNKTEDAAFWTYDYKVVYDKDGKLKLELCGNEVNIAGRKFYWHSKVDESDKAFFPQVEANERNKTVRPVKSNITFTEDIYFDRISRTQLDQLLMILNISREGKWVIARLWKASGAGEHHYECDSCDIRMIGLDEESRSIVYSSQKYEDYFLEKIPVFDSERESYEQFHFEKNNVDLLLRIADFMLWTALRLCILLHRRSYTRFRKAMR